MGVPEKEVTTSCQFNEKFKLHTSIVTSVIVDHSKYCELLIFMLKINLYYHLCNL